MNITASSSLSSAEMLEALPRAPSSPSAASLQLKHEPLTAELSGKSNSAPLLENNNMEKRNGTVQVNDLKKKKFYCLVIIIYTFPSVNNLIFAERNIIQSNLNMKTVDNING